MAQPSLSREELEALHDVLEAARCFWNKHPVARQRATQALQTVNRLYWRLGSELPVTGMPSERFKPVTHSMCGELVDRLTSFISDLCAEYARKHDPWFADTVVLSDSFKREMSNDEFLQLEQNLGRLGMIIIFDSLPESQVALQRSNIGPWPELSTSGILESL